MINTVQLLSRVDLVDLVERHGVELRKSSSEWVGLCPFHSERSPSFSVSVAKGFVHCFGCGAHYDAIGFVMAMDGVDFVTACHQLGGTDAGAAAKRAVHSAPRRLESPVGELWVPIYPVPESAPAWVPGVKGRVWNIKRDRWWDGLTPSRADAYRDTDGSVMAYVLRVDMPDGKITPAVTWCIGPAGEARWCLQPLPEPRPLCGLDDLAARLDAPVMVFEGEKCRAAGAGALSMCVALCWMGGSHGVDKADFSVLSGRDVVLWPDADQPGWDAMLGCVDGSGLLHEGVAQAAYRAGCASLRVVDTHDRPKGWDVADAMADGWSAQQIVAWARAHTRAIDVEQTRAAVK
ncbi:MAG: CHC2 zinc finger domain-containing protein [Rhodanobacter sp.]